MSIILRYIDGAMDVSNVRRNKRRGVWNRVRESKREKTQIRIRIKISAGPLNGRPARRQSARIQFVNDRPETDLLNVDGEQNVRQRNIGGVSSANVYFINLPNPRRLVYYSDRHRRCCREFSDFLVGPVRHTRII